jgi:hypothetical protein
MNVAVKTEALSIFALLLSAPGGFLPLDKDLSWMTQGDHNHHSPKLTAYRRVAERARPGRHACCLIICNRLIRGAVRFLRADPLELSLRSVDAEFS